MINSMRAITKANWESIDQNLIWPLTRWCSGVRPDIIQQLNKEYFTTTNKQKAQWLSTLSIGFVPKYPKETKETPQYVLLIQLLNKKHGWSKRVCKIQKIEWMLQDKVLLIQLADDIGLDNKERKVLGVPLNKLINKPTKEVKPKPKGLMDF